MICALIALAAFGLGMLIGALWQAAHDARRYLGRRK